MTIALKGFVIPGVPRSRHARGRHPARGQAGRELHELRCCWARSAPAWRWCSPTRCRWPSEHADLLLVPASLATVWTGFLMLTTRRKAIMQVLGYLLLENGIFLFGLLAAGGDAVPRRGRRAARSVHRRVRDGHHHPPHQPRVLLDQHGAPDGVEGITDGLLADPVSPGDGGG